MANKFKKRELAGAVDLVNVLNKTVKRHVGISLENFDSGDMVSHEQAVYEIKELIDSLGSCDETSMDN